MEVNRPNTQANDLAMQKLQEQLLKAQEEGIPGIPTTVSITRPDGTEIADEDIKVEITGGIDISDKIDEIIEEQNKIKAEQLLAEEESNKASSSKDESLEEIIASWQYQANLERYLDGTAAEYTDLLNPYQLQGQSSVLSFDDLVNIGEYSSQQSSQTATGVGQQATAATQTESTQGASASGSVQETKPSTTSPSSGKIENPNIIKGEENFGSEEYMLKALKLALPDVDISDTLLYYDLTYDESGKLVGMTKNSIYENIDLPSFVIGYPDTSKMEGVDNCINIIWSAGGISGSNGVEVVKNSDGTTMAMSLDSEGALAETKFYDKDYKDIGISKNLAAGESYTYRGVKVTNPTNATIAVSFLISEGLLAVHAKGATITAVSATDAFSTDKIIITDGENVQTYKEYQRSTSSSDSDSKTDTEAKEKALKNLTSLISALPNALNS